ncbi:MAG TPA: MinD/ParA family protein [Blastocatellia bacterium]|nr:MinD/ParA family protein [Blastocatellia bacterium]
MINQASTLRLMAAIYGNQTNTVTSTGAVSPARQPAPRTRSLAITSGKGGVGKSNVAVNVSLELAALGRSVSLLDADLALANADVLLGLNPQYHLGHVISGHRALKEVVIEVDHGLRLIPGGSGIEELANLSQAQHTQLVTELQEIESEADYMIIDTAAGIAENVTGVLRAADEVIVITTPDPTSVVDAYAMIKVLHQQTPSKPIWIIVNDVVGVGDAERIFAQLQAAATRFLDRRLSHLGTIPRDAELAEAVREQVPVVRYAPTTPASRALRLIAKHLDQLSDRMPAVHRPDQSFWSTLVAPPINSCH